MATNRHLEAPLALFGPPPTSARVVVILLHGRGHSPATMEQAVVRRVGLPDVAYLAPTAANQTWYPAGFMAPLAENEPQLSHALERVREVSDELVRRGVPTEAQVLLGFSQGACLACDFVYREPRRFGALVALTGGLIGPPGTRWNAAPDAWVDMPVLLGGSEDDPWVPASRMRETAEVFRAGGAGVNATFHEGTAHEVTDAQIALTRALFDKLRAARPRERRAAGAAS
jgi:phospholipase/carboxylesterase